MERRVSRLAARRGRILPRRGVRASRVCTSFSRDALVSVNGASVAEYAYDALGNLVAVANGDESFGILVDSGHSLADVVVSPDGTKTPLRVYMRGPGVDSWLGFVDMTGAAPVPYYYVTDHLGSVLAVVDANGNVVERYEYDAWGKVLSVVDGNGQTLSRSAIGNRILWQGREYSWTTGLYYFRNRWYDPTIGRWISKDPIGIQGGINVYAFCDNNPINHADPSGEDFMDFMFAASDFFAGFGDTISFGATRAFREAVYPEFGLTDMTDTSSGCYTVGECSGVAYDIALGAAGGWAAGGTKVKDVTEFSHWIPRRYLKKTGSKFIEKTFGKSKWNGNYVTKARHAMHDPHRHCKGIKKLPPLLRQLDRVPRVYYGLLAGGGAGATSVWILSDIDK